MKTSTKFLLFFNAISVIGFLLSEWIYLGSYSFISGMDLTFDEISLILLRYLFLIVFVISLVWLIVQFVKELKEKKETKK